MLVMVYYFIPFLSIMGRMQLIRIVSLPDFNGNILFSFEDARFGQQIGADIAITVTAK